MKKLLVALCLSVASFGCNPTDAQNQAQATAPKSQVQVARAATPKATPQPDRVKTLLARPVPEVGKKVAFDDAYYKQTLTDKEYAILRGKGTEAAFSGVYNDAKADGVFHCRACNAPLFQSKTKFDSKTGWPSFYAPVKGRVDTAVDTKYGMVRTEIVCSNCGSHLGHVFADGPDPTGLRYCVNSASLTLSEGEAQDAELDVDQKTFE